jgi:anti-anti-sigma regulatory factor
MTMTRRLELPNELCVPAVSALRLACLEWLDAQDADELVDASQVDEVDAAGVQLLVALSRSLTSRGRRLQLHAPSDPLRDALRTLAAYALIPPTAAGDAR